jgi:hypothetical protein
MTSRLWFLSELHARPTGGVALRPPPSWALFSGDTCPFRVSRPLLWLTLLTLALATGCSPPTGPRWPLLPSGSAVNCMRPSPMYGRWVAPATTFGWLQKVYEKYSHRLSRPLRFCRFQFQRKRPQQPKNQPTPPNVMRPFAPRRRPFRPHFTYLFRLVLTRSRWPQLAT